MKVYVAASSKQLERAKAAMAAVRELGHEVSHDWVSIIEARGQANPTDCDSFERASFAAEDLAGVERSDMLWLLYPSDGSSVGAFWEAGYAQGRGIPVVVSGLSDGSIFPANCDWCYDRDDDCLTCEFDNRDH